MGPVIVGGHQLSSERYRPFAIYILLSPPLVNPPHYGTLWGCVAMALRPWTSMRWLVNGNLLLILQGFRFYAAITNCNSIIM